MNDELSGLINKALSDLGLEETEFVLEHPNDMSHGDYATNVAMILAKKTSSNPQELAEKIKSKIEENQSPKISKIEIAGPGFINFYLSKSFFSESIKLLINKGIRCGTNKSLENETLMIEYTDPNPFKVLHIGHVMSNTIGEALARLAEANGAKVARVCYQGDVGLHIAMAVWGMKQNIISLPKDDESTRIKADFLGKAYSFGRREYEKNKETKEEITEINKKLFAKSDPELNELYEKGRDWSLLSFEVAYKALGTKFDHYFFESATVDDAMAMVNKGLDSKVFEESDGAIIYSGDKSGLHTRVFVNQHKLPTYEAKELGLAILKEKVLPEATKYMTITANEQAEYMKVVYSALAELRPELRKKMEHITHGAIRLTTGKMSSRTGSIISADDLMRDVIGEVQEKMSANENDSDISNDAVTVAVAAIKYSILKQSIGKDIIFDIDKSISFEGDSGPYLQYTYTRAKALTEKAEAEGIAFKDALQPADWEVTDVEKLAYRFPDIVKEAYEERAPHKLVGYLTELSSAFNSFYAQGKIVDKEGTDSGYRLTITEAVKAILRNGLIFAGMGVPQKM